MEAAVEGAVLTIVDDPSTLLGEGFQGVDLLPDLDLLILPLGNKCQGSGNCTKIPFTNGSSFNSLTFFSTSS